MALGYKYVERDADSQINYFDLGQQAVGMLQDWEKGREEKKEAYRQAYRESINNLMDAPQGKDQDANDFTSDYAQSMITQQTLNKRLLESGNMSEKQYTLSLQNQMDGTKRLFNLQKLYQDNFESTMKDMNDKKIQRGLTTFNQRSVEGAANFNNSKAFIDPIDGTVSVGLMENKVIDGKLVKVLNKNTAASTSVWTGRILQKPVYFDVDNETKGFVDGLGELKVAVYNAADTLKAGTITDLTGLEFVKSIENPTTKAIVTEFNKAIDAEVESYLRPLNVASILTDDLRKYNDESFTFDREEADKDPKKILVKIDPVAKMTTLDPTGKNYEAQKKEAFDYVRNQIISKLDEEKKISTTSQLSETEAQKLRAQSKYPKPVGGEKDDTKPVILNQVLLSKDPKNRKITTGSVSTIQNLVLPEAEGVENYIETIGYDSKKGTLYVEGYQVSGKETTKDGKKSEDVVKRTKLFSSDKGDNAGLLSIVVPMLRNPADPNGNNFSSIAQAKDYYRRVYENKGGGVATTPATSKKSNNDPLNLGL